MNEPFKVISYGIPVMPGVLPSGSHGTSRRVLVLNTVPDPEKLPDLFYEN